VDLAVSGCQYRRILMVVSGAGAMGKRGVFYLTVVVFLAYSAWMIGPYLRSVIVRDASVTTWSRAAVTPIDGRIVSDLPEPGNLIGEEGHVATIRNALLLEAGRAVEDTRDRAIDAEARIAEADEYLADLARIERERQAARDEHARVFHDQLETEVRNLRAGIALDTERIEVLERIAERQQSLVSRGAGSEATLDEALLRVAEMKAEQAQLESALNFALLRDRSAENGVFITADGGTPDWVRHGELELKLEQRRTEHEKHVAEAELAEARKDLEIEMKTLAELAEATVTAPPGSLVHSVLAAPDATLSAGDRVIEWLDCTALLVDVPVSDAELPLIKRGMPAEVVLEGEPTVREATVHLTRGSTATLDRTDLAAIAKGRTEGVAQVLLTLDADPTEFDRCPVGRAAYVEFPAVGLIDVLRARLRL
jgi:multidrug resistance efflux pump